MHKDNNLRFTLVTAGSDGIKVGRLVLFFSEGPALKPLAWLLPFGCVGDEMGQSVTLMKILKSS